MPSPFPGMDPYLEDPEFFPGLHDNLATFIEQDLQRSLPPDYYAANASRVWIEFGDRHTVPDVGVLQPKPMPSRVERNGGSVAVADTPAIGMISLPASHDEISENFVEIYTKRGHRRLVTSIEILSLSNKGLGGDGQSLYALKKKELMMSKVHAVEIDLLRAGKHMTFAPLDRLRQTAGPYDYHVSIRRYDRSAMIDVLPIRLMDRLPSIPIPLLPGDEPVQLDLQVVFDRAYDAGPYARIQPYNERPPEPPLSKEQAAWANELLRAKGLLAEG